MQKYLFSYKYNGSDWSFELPAESFEDAEARLKAIGLSGKVDGVLELEMPAFEEGSPDNN